MFGLTINNFRSLGSQQFDFSKVNILIGENSSGKSSLMKFLQFLRESQKYTDRSVKYSPDLGKYEDFIYKHNDELNISFTIELKTDYIEFFIEEFKRDKDWRPFLKELKLLKEQFQTVSMTFEFSKDVIKSNDVKVKIENSHFGKIEISRNLDSKTDILRGKESTVKITDRDNKTHVFKDIGYDQHGFMTFLSSSDLVDAIGVKFKTGPDEPSDQLYHEIGFLLIAQNYFQDRLTSIRYINPIESSPERIYNESENQGIYPVKTIRDVVNILTDETLDEETKSHLLTKLNEAIRSYGILYQIKPRDSGFGATELRVKVSKDGIWSNIKDVGYGSSLQIPILFQAILGQVLGGEIIMIEQPEIHIHPFLQSKFIETLLNIGSLNTFIIETHSEDIIRKLQVMTKKKLCGLKTESVQVYYFKRGKKNLSEISSHKINEYGKLTPAFPSGFYDTSSSLVKELF